MLLLLATFFGIFNPLLSLPAMCLLFVGSGLLHNDDLFGLGFVALILSVVMMSYSTTLGV